MEYKIQMGVTMNDGTSRSEWIKNIESQKIDSQFDTGF